MVIETTLVFNQTNFFLRKYELRVKKSKGQTMDWQTPLHAAFESNDLTGVMHLLEENADVDAMCNSKCTPIAHYNHFDDSNLELQVMRIIFQRATSLTTPDCTGEMQVAQLLRNGKKETLRLLFRSNFDLSAKDEVGRNSLHYLAMNPTLHDNRDALDELRDKHLDVDAIDFYHRNALFYAAKYASPNLLRFLLERNADVNVTDYRRLTTLQALCEQWIIAANKYRKNYYECAKILLQHGVDLQACTISGKTVFDYTLEGMDFNLSRIIMTHLVLLEARNVRINDLIRKRINSHRWLSNQYKLCELQLARLKNIDIPEFTTLFGFLCESDEKMARYLRNQEFLSTLKCIRERFKIKSELFDTCWASIEKSIEKNQVRKSAAEFVCGLVGFSYHANWLIVDKILKWFTHEDFEKLLALI